MLLGRTKAHDIFDAGAVVPAAVEDHDLPPGGELLDVALQEHLRLLSIGRRGQGHDAEYAGTDLLGERLDRAALAGAVAALEDDADLETLVDDPLLQLDELDVQLPEGLLVFLVAERGRRDVGRVRRRACDRSARLGGRRVRGRGLDRRRPFLLRHAVFSARACDYLSAGSTVTATASV